MACKVRDERERQEILEVQLYEKSVRKATMQEDQDKVLQFMEEFIKRAALITTKTSDVPYPSEDRYKDAWALARDIANADKGGQ